MRSMYLAVIAKGGYGYEKLKWKIQKERKNKNSTSRKIHQYKNTFYGNIF